MDRYETWKISADAKIVLRAIDNDSLRVASAVELRLMRVQCRDGGATNSQEELALKYAMQWIGEELAARIARCTNAILIVISFLTLVVTAASVVATFRHW